MKPQILASAPTIDSLRMLIADYWCAMVDDIEVDGANIFRRGEFMPRHQVRQLGDRWRFECIRPLSPPTPPAAASALFASMPIGEPVTGQQHELPFPGPSQLDIEDARPAQPDAPGQKILY